MNLSSTDEWSPPQSSYHAGCCDLFWLSCPNSLFLSSRHSWRKLLMSCLPKASTQEPSSSTLPLLKLTRVLQCTCATGVSHDGPLCCSVTAPFAPCVTTEQHFQQNTLLTDARGVGYVVVV